MQKRLGLVSLLRLFSLLTDHKLVIFVALLQLLACHLHCLKSKQDHLNLQLQYFSFHTSPVMLESQLCMLFCQCARSRRETSLLFWNYIGSAVLTAGKNISQVNRYDSGQTEFLFQSHFWPHSHTGPRDTNPCDTVQEHCAPANYKLAHSGVYPCPGSSLLVSAAPEQHYSRLQSPSTFQVFNRSLLIHNYFPFPLPSKFCPG